MAFELEKDENGYLINPAGRVLGYARVSTKDQRTDRQELSLQQYGVRPENIVCEYESGKNFNRPIYRRLIKTLRRGDILTIKSLDRLGRNYQDIMDQWRLITQDLGCGIHVVDMPALNTTADPEDLLSRFITDMMLQVLSFVAENERINTLQRQKEGIEAARRRGDYMGKAKVKISREFWNVYIIWRHHWARTKELIAYCTEQYNISARSFYRKLDETNDLFKDIPLEELKDLPFEEYGAQLEHLTGNDDGRNADVEDLAEHTIEEILEVIYEKREEEARRLAAEPKKKRKRKKDAAPKRGRPRKNPNDPKWKKKDAETARKKAEKAKADAVVRTIIVD